MLSLFSFPPLRRIVIAFCLVLCIAISGIYAPSAIAQTSQPESYLIRLESLSDRFNQLETYINQNSWSDIKSIIHGPLGEIRSDISRVIRALPAKAQKDAKGLAQKLFDDLVAIDFAAADQNPSTTRAAYDRMRKDYERIQDLFTNG